MLRRPTSARRPVGLGVAGVLVLTLALTASPAAAAARQFTLDLGARRDFVPHTNNVQCVGASMQMMLNMLAPGADRSAATQLRLQKVARAWSPPRPDGRVRKGANVVGWAAGLTLAGAGPYRVVGVATLDEALLIAARAMRTTNRPVGLLVWRGRHAWVMSGFRSTADPRRADAFAVTGIRVLDPLFPHGSGRWGKSPKPNTVVSPATLARQYVIRDHGRVDLGVPPGYLLVLPVRGPNDEA